MTITLAQNAARVSYSVSEGATQTSFTVSFEFFDAADLNVYVDGTLKTISTHSTHYSLKVLSFFDKNPLKCRKSRVKTENRHKKYKKSD